jgi:hypothetical protein
MAAPSTRVGEFVAIAALSSLRVANRLCGANFSHRSFMKRSSDMKNINTYNEQHTKGGAIWLTRRGPVNA